jgi:quercetin dioxygenase-like cupin family protein
MIIKRAADIAVTKGPADYFTGEVKIEQLLQPATPSRAAAALVTFQPGARTHWHTHPLGQTIIIVEGEGRCQLWGGAVEVMHKGDVITFAPGEKHWHGASAETAMAHIAIQEAVDGKAVDWLEAVT